ncbi:GlxA family transcriptional regulator [Enterobacter genomosp. O]|uniref:AraC family transcriptional regulator n=1 Tax=Enterobacter genomosp. O TaxID=2364150 RepID=A0A0X4ET35_9ENTR|nr:helix-turn-helix domain-containing protein [Enterobacter genomosp. O]KUQ84812.1 AraC family transcriptional regulator [Enterobacter genomosp. O]
MSYEIAVLAVPNVQLLDVCGPLDVFAEANRLMKREIYKATIISINSSTIRASSGVRLDADIQLDKTDHYFPDTFLVAGSPDMENFKAGKGLIDKITAICQASRRYGSVCSGAFLLAHTGLLSGKHITTHWAYAGKLAIAFPEIIVNADALYVQDDRLRTAAGVTSGLDLALRLVEEDLGRDIAQEVAAQLVMFFRRPVNQTHFMRDSGISVSGRSVFQELQRWVITNIDTVKTVSQMAEHLNISERHLTRLFHTELGMTPRQWLDRERVAKVRQLMEENKLPLKVMALQSGFSCVDVMRRVFVRVTGMTPAAYSRMTSRD